MYVCVCVCWTHGERGHPSSMVIQSTLSLTSQSQVFVCVFHCLLQRAQYLLSFSGYTYPRAESEEMGEDGSGRET